MKMPTKIALVLGLLAATASADVLVIENARVFPVSSPPIEDATVVVSDNGASREAVNTIRCSFMFRG